MFESKYNKLLTVILVIVVIAIIGLLAYLGFSFFSEKADTDDAAAFVDNYNFDDNEPEENNPTENENPDGENPLEQTGDEGGSGESGSTSKKTYKGYTVNGTMKIPKINFSYPVLERVTKSSIETSVAILYGAGLNQVGNTVIIGHNYRNGQFFSNNKKLTNGDKIYITDYEGNQKTYVIYNKFETTPEDTSFYQRDTNGKAEITLSTCTDDSSARLIIFAREE